MFEIYLPIAVLAPVLVYFVPGQLSSAARATLFDIVFAASLISRSIGAVILAILATDSAGAGPSAFQSAALALRHS